MNEQNRDIRKLMEGVLSALKLSDSDKMGANINKNMELTMVLDKFIDMMPGGFFIYKAAGDGEIIYINKAMLRIFNCDTLEEFKEITGNTFKGLVHDDDFDRVQNSIEQQVSKNDDDMDYVEYRIIRKGGEICWIEDYGHFVHDDILGDIFYVFIADVTERKMHQIKEQTKMLEDALQRANAANHAKDIFLANMSHDLRTPMNAILGLTDLIKKNINDRKKLFLYLSKIEDSSEQLMHLINNVLEVSRLGSGTVLLNENECDIYNVLRSICSKMQPKATAKNIVFNLKISNLKNDIVYCDQQKLIEVLNNLVDNAIKYTDRGGKITVSVAEEKNQLIGSATYKFAVEDTGIGISEKFIDRIYRPFERQINTTLSGVPGTGLGLTIVKNLVDIMGGGIEVKSKPGKGCRFVVTLRFQTIGRKEDSGLEEITKADIDMSKQRKILIVEDNDINMEIEVELMKSEGFDVDMAENGREGFELVKKSSPGEYNLILMDIQMPVMDGYDAAKAIRGLANPELASIPIIALSANTFDEDKKLSMESGMNAHLEKPIDPPKLMDMIWKMID